MSFLVLAEISAAFEGEGFVTGDPDPYVSGQRRTLASQYMRKIDWTDTSEVRRALNVFEEVLRKAEPERRLDLIERLELDSFFTDDKFRIRRSADGFGLYPHQIPADAPGILDQLERLIAAGSANPADAISSSKALVEATLRLACERRGVEYATNDNIPTLSKKALRALKLDPEALAPTTKGVDAISTVFRSLASIPAAMAELRNEYGPDHGKIGSVGGLRPRHAELAIGTATTFVRFVLATIDERPAGGDPGGPRPAG